MSASITLGKTSNGKAIGAIGRLLEAIRARFFVSHKEAEWGVNIAKGAIGARMIQPKGMNVAKGVIGARIFQPQVNVETKADHD